MNAATGLRLSEALHLRCGDVDHDQGVLTVRNTKFRRIRRHVPMHPTVATALEPLHGGAVASRRHQPGLFAVPLLIGELLPKRTIMGCSSGCEANSARRRRGAYAQARYHDLRHIFICRRVQLWYEHGRRYRQPMAALSTYVGHAKVSDTYWYLTGVAELMAIVGERFEQFAADRRRGSPGLIRSRRHPFRSCSSASS